MNIETERKFLIVRPDESLLTAQDGCRVLDITQTYLMINNVTGEERRIRRIEENGKVSYVLTEKRRISTVSREENEREISREEYEKLYETDGARELTKTRYAFPYGKRTVEIDVYPHEIGGDGLDGLAVLEVELEDETEEIILPDFITVIRELTGKKEFSNKAMAKLRR